MSVGEFCSSQLSAMKNVIKNTNNGKLTPSHKSVVAFMAVKGMLEGKNVLSSRTEMYRDYPNSSDLIKKLTGFTSDDFINGVATDEAKFLLDNERVNLMRLASIAKSDPNDFRRAVIDLKVSDDEDINDMVYDYAKDYWAGRFRGKTASGIDKFFAMLASATLLKGINGVQSATGNQNQLYDIHPDSSAIYNKSATIANMVERFHGEASRGLKHLVDMTKSFTVVTQDMISEMHHLMSNDFVRHEKKGPHESYEYTDLRGALVTKLSEMHIDSNKLDTAMSEFIKFNDAFQRFNYGISDNQKMFFNQTKGPDGAIEIYERSSDRKTWSKQGKLYDPNDFKGSWLFKVKTLGEATIRALDGIPDKDLLPVERQIKENFSKDSTNQFNIRLGYSPLFSKKNGSDGLFDIEKLTANIPTLSFLKDRDSEISGRSTKGNLLADMNDELAITRLVYTQLADLTLMRNTEKMLGDNKFDNIITGRSRTVLNEKVESLKNHFKAERPAGSLRHMIKLGSSFSTMYGSAILNKPSSAINNWVGGKVVAKLNDIGISGLSYGDAQKVWRAKSEGAEGEVKFYINEYIDRVIQPFSRQEASISTEEAITDWSGKLSATTQYIADKTADAGMMAVPAMICEKFFGVDITQHGSIKNMVMSQRQSENTLRKDYYKGLAFQMVQAKIGLAEYKKMAETNGKEYVIDQILKDSADDIAYYERRIHGDFSRSAKSMKTMFAMSDAQTFTQAALGLMVTFETMFKAPEIFAMSSYIENLASNAIAAKETGVYGKAVKTAIASAGPALALTMIDSSQWIGSSPIQAVASVNPAGSAMDVAELGFILTSTMLGNATNEELAASAFQKLSRIGAGVMMSGNFQQASFKMQKGEPAFQALASSFDFNPLNALAGVRKRFGVDGEEFVMEGKNEIKDMAFYGSLLDRYTRRGAAITGIFNSIREDGLKSASDKVINLIVKDEMGFKTMKPDALIYGSDKAIFKGGLLKAGNDEMSQDAFNAMRSVFGE